MDQPTFADLEYESKKRKTRREIFMDALIGNRSHPSVLSQGGPRPSTI